MKKNKWIVSLAKILCIILLLTGVPVLAEQTAPPSTTKSTTPKAVNPSDNTTTEEKKVSGKMIKKPPYVITVNDTISRDNLAPEMWNLGDSVTLNLIGKRDDEKIAGEWLFYVSYSYFAAGDTKQFEHMVGGINFGLEMRMQGTATGQLIDLVAKKKKEEKEKRAKGEYPTPPPKQEPVHTDPNTAKNSQEAPVDAYSAEFDVVLSGEAHNLGDNTFAGTIASDNGSQWITVNSNFLPEGEQRETGKIKLNLDSNNNVTVEVTASGKTVGPFVGTFTSEEELQVKRKDTYKWPIWGVWTDVNPYEPMPNLQKDVATIQEQIKNKETLKKINYPIGRWVMMKLGKKEDPSIYKTIQVSKDDITFETGEIWPYPGSAMFVPTELTVYSKDLKDVISTDVPGEYEQTITYSTVTDTIEYPDFGRLVRVRNANLLGVWSSVGPIDMPDLKERAITPGTWYEFTRGTEEDAKKVQKGYSAPYTFTRLTVNADKSMIIDKGTAIIMPIADDEIVVLSGIKTEKVSKEGKSEKSDSEDETLSVSDFNKDAGIVKLSLRDYTLIPGLPLKGSWSTETPFVEPPDVESGSFSCKNAAGEVIEPSTDAQWFKFDKEKKSFEWTQMLEAENGILVRKGKYRTIGEDLLLLSEIKGSFYARPGSNVSSFKDQDYKYGEKLFQVNQTKKDDVPDSLSIGGVGSFKPLETSVK